VPVKKTAVPVIETKRLMMRAHTADDLAAAAAMWADPVVTRHIGGKPSAEPQTWSRLLNYAGLWALLGYGYWAVEEKSSGRYIGDVGFADFKRGLPAIAGVPELGWALVSSAHGKGYATEAARAACDWGDKRFNPRRTVCMIDPGNTASVRVAEKCGFRKFKRATYKDAPTILFARVSPAPRASRG
jgi:RimJ/RimL family protein N-acetyltransferase